MDAVLVTGGASGLGLTTSLYLAWHGFKVYAATRAAEQSEVVRSAAERQRADVLTLQLDVTDSKSIAAAIDTIVKESGGIYGLVNNAGHMLRGCVEDVPDDEVRALFEVNVFGLMAVTRQALPHMRGAGRGRIVTISSSGAKLASFGVSHYCASKCAAEGFGEALELEIAPFGLHSVLIEPGMIKTAFWTTSRRTVPRALDPGSAYYEMFQRHESVADRIVDRSRNSPMEVAKAVHHALTAGRPKLRYVIGQPASTFLTLRRHLPGDLFDRLYFGALLRLIGRPPLDAYQRRW